MLNRDVNTVNQSGATARGDNVGRDKNTTVNFHERQTQLEGWIDKLHAELESNPNFQQTVDNLQYFLERHRHDDIVGLTAKLDHSGRQKQKPSALRKKEAFSKFLTDWQAYPAAQEIIAYFLSKIEATFAAEIVPLLASATPDEVDAAVKDRLIDPVLDEMGYGPFMLNHTNVSGMVYWLAEQCYIRWHS